VPRPQQGPSDPAGDGNSVLNALLRLVQGVCTEAISTLKMGLPGLMSQSMNLCKSLTGHY